MLLPRLSLMRDGETVIAVLTPKGCHGGQDHRFQLMGQNPVSDEELRRYDGMRSPSARGTSASPRKPLYRFRCLECGIDTIQAMLKVTGAIDPTEKTKK